MATGYVRCNCGNEYKPAITSTCPKCQRPASEAQEVVSVPQLVVDVAHATDQPAQHAQTESWLNTDAVQPKLHVEKIKLFDTPFYTDKAFFIGGALVLVMAAVNAYNNAHTTGIAHTGLGVISGLFDGAIYLGVGFALFCLIPAFIRRSTRKGTLKNSKPASTQPGAYPDPIARGRRRFWNGVKWTDQVTDFDYPRKTSGKAIIGGLVGVGAVLSLAGILGIQSGAQPITAAFDNVSLDIKAYNEQTNAATTVNGGSARWASVLAEFAPKLIADANELSAAVKDANLTPTSNIDGLSGASITALTSATINFVQAVANMNQGFILCGPGALACYDNVIMTQRDAYLAAAQNLQSVARAAQGNTY